MAMVLGVISPKTNIMKVITPVAIPIHEEPNNQVKTTVAKKAAPILTKLLQIRIVTINF